MTEYSATQLGLQDTKSSPLNSQSGSYTQNATKEAIKDLSFGSVAGIVGKVIEYPFDTVKVRLQSQSSTGPLRYSGPLDCFRKSLRDGGVASLYRGISAPMVGAAVETSSLFFSYRLAQRCVSAVMDQPAGPKLPLGSLVVCGAASGAFTSALLTPIELVKCQMQVPGGGRQSNMRNPWGVIATIYRHTGLSGFWRGQLGTFIRETGGSAAWFGSYEGICAALQQYDARATSAAPDPQPVWQQLLAGAGAGMAYNFICYPADTVKSRMQTEEVGAATSGASRRTFWLVGKDLWAQQGLAGMYRGCGLTVARAAPSSAFIFAVYETLLRWSK